MNAACRRAAGLLSFTLLLAGCVVGQQLSLNNEPEPAGAVGAGQGVAVEVEDLRPDVVSGRKKPWYVGVYRAGLGNPWSVSTEGKVPLAEQLKADLAEELLSLGFSPSKAGTTLRVSIREWDFTGYQNGRFWYALDVEVLDPAGNLAASDSLTEEIPIRGTLLLGARGGFERDMPGIYERIVRSLARDNPGVLRSLEG